MCCDCESSIGGSKADKKLFWAENKGAENSSSYRPLGEYFKHSIQFCFCLKTFLLPRPLKSFTAIVSRVWESKITAWFNKISHVCMVFPIFINTNNHTTSPLFVPRAICFPSGLNATERAHWFGGWDDDVAARWSCEIYLNLKIGCDAMCMEWRRRRFR